MSYRKAEMLLPELRISRSHNDSNSQIHTNASISWASCLWTSWVSVRDCHQANLSLALEILELKKKNQWSHVRNDVCMKLVTESDDYVAEYGKQTSSPSIGGRASK